MTNRVLANQFKPQEQGVTVLKLYADWCAPCKAFSPEFDTAADVNLEATFVSVNIDDDGGRELAGMYNVRSIPTVVFFKDGERVKSCNNIAFQECLTEVLSA